MTCEDDQTYTLLLLTDARVLTDLSTNTTADFYAGILLI
jgi:hypothetical protein